MCELLAPRTSRRYMDTHFKGRRTIRMIGVLAIAELSSFVGWFPYHHLDLSSRPKKKMDAIESVNGARADVVQSITSD